MRRLLVLIALVAGVFLPATGAFGTPATVSKPEPTGIGIRLVDAPVATRDDPRAAVYIIDHVKPGTTIERRVEVSNHTGGRTDVAVYPAAAAITDGSFVGLEGDTPNDLTTWTRVSTPRLPLADGDEQMVTVTIDVPDDAAPGEQYAVLWAQTTSGGSSAVTQVSRVGVRVYLSVGPGGAPASAFDIQSFTAERDRTGTPVVSATVHNTGGRALDLRGQLTLRDGPGGLSAGPFPVTLGTTLGLGATEPVTVELDQELPNGPWKARITLTSGLLSESAHAALTFPTSGTGETVPAASDDVAGSRWPLIAGAGLALLAAVGLVWWLLRRRRGGGSPPGGHRSGVPTSRPEPVSTPAPSTWSVFRQARLVGVASVLLVVGSVAGLGATPAAVADTSATTGASVTLVGGGLSLTAPTNAGNLSTRSDQVGAITLSGPLGQVQVTDSRSAPGGSGWTATAISTAFTPPAGPAIGAAFVGYVAGPITKTGTATYTADDPVNLTGVSAVVTATEINGDNTASWNPTIKVAFTAGMAAGVYTGTITHSVS